MEGGGKKIGNALKFSSFDAFEKNLVKSKKKIFVKKQKKKKSQQIVITGIIVMHIKNV